MSEIARFQRISRICYPILLHILLFPLFCLLGKGYAISIAERCAKMKANLTVTTLIRYSMTSLAPALYLAAKDIEKTVLPGCKLEVRFHDLLKCSRVAGMQSVMNEEYIARRDSRSVIGGILIDNCNKVCQDVGFYGGAMGISVVSLGCFDPVLSKAARERRDEKPSTFVSTVSFGSHMVDVIAAIANGYNWTRILLVNVNGDEIQATHSKLINESSMQNNAYRKLEFFRIEVPSPLINEFDLTWKEQILKAKETAMVMFLLFGKNRVAITQFMLTAFQLDMFNGSYVFITVDFRLILPTKSNQNIPTRDISLPWSLDQTLAYIQEGLMTINMKHPSTNREADFVGKLRDIGGSQLASNIPQMPPKAQIPLMTYDAYEAMMVWGHGFKQALQDEPTDFFKFSASIEKRIEAAAKVFNASFESYTGQVTVDTVYGDRYWDVEIQMIQSGKFVTIGEFKASIGQLYDFDSRKALYWPGGFNFTPLGRPKCGWNDNLCPKSPKDTSRSLIIGLSILCALLLVVALIVPLVVLKCIRQNRIRHELTSSREWSIHYEELDFITGSAHQENINASNQTVNRVTSNLSAKLSNFAFNITSNIFRFNSEFHEFIGSTKEISFDMFRLQHFNRPMRLHKDDRVAIYLNYPVFVLHITKDSVTFKDEELLQEIRKMRAINNGNLARFIGICQDVPNVCIVMEGSIRGTLHDVIHNHVLDLEFDFMLSFLVDISKGMVYLQHSEIGSHGNLSSLACIVDDRWTCKVTDFGLAPLRKIGRRLGFERLSSMRSSESTEKPLIRYPFWTAPELLRIPQTKRPTYGTKKGDVYSFAIIMYEIVMKLIPFSVELEMSSPEKIVEKIKAKDGEPFRPSKPSHHLRNEWDELIERAWDEMPSNRPTFSEMLDIIEGNTLHYSDFATKLMFMLEMHSFRLEELISDRTRETNVERQRAASLLYSLLPQSVADTLRRNEDIIPQNFDSVTIYCSDIVGFTHLAARSSPMQIVTLLGSLYGKFDAIIDRHDAYKVGTIGDAYIVASGVPVRNEERHAIEIAQIALEALEVVKSFSVPHASNETIRVRIGIHTGPVLAGVLGFKVPYYCLFGPTVSIAAKAESTGVPDQIQVTQSTAVILLKTGEFELKMRDTVFVKEGSYSFPSYFLIGYKRAESDL